MEITHQSKDDGTKASQMEPLTTLGSTGSEDPRDLWKWMESYEEKTGGQMLAIAHNGNLSNGTMFPLIESFNGKPFDREYAEARMRWESLYEATQIKGDGEAHPFLSPDDEFADYETWDKSSLHLKPKKEKMLQYEYVRSALKLGLQLEAEKGVNPYKFGMVGSTDTHTGLAALEEDNFFGKHTGTEPSAERTSHVLFDFGTGIQYIGWEQAASGYTGVWARENTREAVGNTVDVANASWTNTIGETELITMWAYTRWARYRRVPDAPSSHRLGGRGRSTSRRRLSIVASVSPKRVHSRTRSDSHRSRDPP
ncbi:MAG: DUF3604 domain-containing protein [Desulfobacterales bacterium]|nr:DUF3604 domain-containing protein [Desulfobacterales bacterium]